MTNVNTATNNEVTKSPTKADLAREIFAVYGNDKPRKDIIKMFMDDLGMSKAGASTYYHNVKTAAQKSKIEVADQTDVNDPLRVVEGESPTDRKNRIRRERRALAKAEEASHTTADVTDVQEDGNEDSTES